MKIQNIRVTPVNIPQAAPFFISIGTCYGFTKVIVQVFTDEGLVGLGEAPSLGCASLITDWMAPRLVGQDPLDIEACWRLCVPDPNVASEDPSYLRAFGGIEMALWDLRGKVWDKPLYLLLGGAVRKDILFTEYFAYRRRVGEVGGELSPKEVATYCAKMRELHGSKYFEGKCPPGDPEATIQTVKEIRSALGDDAKIRLDANMGFSVEAARQILARTEQWNLANFEDPVPGFYATSRLRESTSVPFSSHVPDLRLAVQLGVPDTFVLNLARLGGIIRTLRFVAACERMGIGFWCYSGDSGIGSAAYMHVIAATEHIRLPSQSLFRWQVDDVIEEGPFEPKGNVVRVPEGPGLGVTLSERRLAACHERFRNDGPYDDHQDPVSPGLYARTPLI